LISCSSGSGQKGDLQNIELIENMLLPSVVIQGVENEGYNILSRMQHYKVPGVSIAFLNGGEIVWAKGCRNGTVSPLKYTLNWKISSLIPMMELRFYLKKTIPELLLR